METQKYVRKPFFCEAVQVTAENMDEVAEWCKGTIEAEGGRQFIRVEVNNPMTDRQTQAFVNDWVLFANRGYKVYNPRAFERSFDPAYTEENPNQPALPIEHDNYRSAETGQFVSESEAEKNPDTTVHES